MRNLFHNIGVLPFPCAGHRFRVPPPNQPFTHPVANNPPSYVFFYTVVLRTRTVFRQFPTAKRLRRLLAWVTAPRLHVFLSSWLTAHGQHVRSRAQYPLGTPSLAAVPCHVPSSLHRAGWFTHLQKCISF